MPELRSKTNKAVIQRVSLTLFFCLVPALVLAAAPKGALKINNDAPYTNTTAVTLTLSATSTGTGVSQMRFSTDNRNWSNPEAYTTTKAWVLSPSNGKKTVYVKFKDNAKKWSSAFSDTIILDTAAPTTKISGTSDLWKNTNIRVSLRAKDSGSGLYQTYYSTDGKNPPTSVYTGALSFTLEGLYTLIYYSLDKAGNSETVKTANVKIDKTPPTGSIKINNDNPCTNSTAVTLNLQAQDALSGMGAGAQMQFSNNNTQWSKAQAYALTASWKLISGSGAKTVYIKFKDVAGNCSGVYSDTISLDTTLPTTPVVSDDGATTASTTQLHVAWNSSDPDSGIAEYQYRITQDSKTGTAVVDWTSTATANNVTKSGLSLTPNKTYYFAVKAKNGAGLWSAVGYSDGIKVVLPSDTTPPSISIKPIISPTNQNVVLSYTVSDNFTPANEILVTGDNSPYTKEGVYNVTLTAKDKAGNTSTATASFTIDKTPPVVVITSPSDGAVVEDRQVQLQGTVDRAAFSENRTLNEGENTLTKIAADAAGNSASAAVKVYLYLGQLIGPQGGEIVSPDGRVKVIIPSGALSEFQQIRIFSLNKETLEQAAPKGKNLLSVVECKPYGLALSRPAALIYILASAEIPGTTVELGYYDRVNDKIISTGQVSVVPADGYTLTFSIMHFSTYAALSGMVSQGAPIGAGVKIPLPDMLTGAFSHAIPITVPPGRKGVQPALALSYRSSNPNSWVGLGFSLNAGYIVRSTRLGPPTYIDTQDTFYFITDAGTTELVHLVDNLYQAKVESSFTKFFKETDDSWKAVGKDGSVLRFGQATDSKETATLGTFAWYLTKAADTNGNYIEYHYIKDQGKSYLSRIDYTGNEMGISPANYVEFLLESRNDISSSYISGSKIATAKRLKEIQVKQNYDLVWCYELEYAYSPDTNRSLLKSITQHGSDGKSLPEQRLNYQRAK